MKQYNKLKKKYDDLIKQSLEENKKILIESFVEYYGEEFRNIIEKRYNEITFIYYIDWNIVDLVVNEFIPQVNNPDKYVDFINFNNSRKKSLFSKIFKNSKKKSNLPDNLIGMTNPSVINEDAIVTWLFEALSESSPCNANYESADHMYRLISFQILTLNERTIIHEINHAITRENIAYIIEDNIPIDAVAKAGISVDISSQIKLEKNVEELINEKTSKEIEKIFKSRGGNLSDFCLNIPLLYIYKHNFYLIDDFYEHFEKYIKIARISNNKNELVSRVGKKEYDEFIKIVNKCYTEDITQIEYYKKKYLPIIKRLVEKMSKNANNCNTSSKDEINDYLKQRLKLVNNLQMINDVLNNESEYSIYESKNRIQRK